VEEDVIRAASIALISSAALAGAALTAYQAGKVHERGHWLELENSTLRERAKEITRQVQLVAEKQKAYNDAQIQIADFAARLRGTDRLRVQAEHRAHIERASAASLRTYAAGINDLYESCRAEYIELGLEAARTAAALEALNKQ
jgi:hypothetical protein